MNEHYYKFVSLAGFKSAAPLNGTDSGSLEGYASKYGELDNGDVTPDGKRFGDIVLRGAFADTLAQFLERGFNTKSHDWSVDGMIGYPVVANEDDTGLFVKFNFHSTPDAQNVRVKTMERLAAGKTVGLSIGWSPGTKPILIQQKDYETELPKYVAQESLAGTLTKAGKYDFVRVLPRVNLHEVAVVCEGMLDSALATNVKSAAVLPLHNTAHNEKGLFQESLAEMTKPEPWEMFWALCDAVQKIDDLEDASEGTDIAGQVDVAALLDEAIAEFTAAFRARALADLQADETEDNVPGIPDIIDTIYGSGASRQSVETKVRAQFAMQTAATFAALKRLAVRAQNLSDIRRKEGRTISAATREQLDAIYDFALQTLGILKTMYDGSPAPDTPTEVEQTQTLVGGDDKTSAPDLQHKQKQAETFYLRLKAQGIGVTLQ